MPDIFLGNLSHSILVQDLRDSIIHLFSILHFHIKHKECTIKRKESKTFAFVTLLSEKDVNFALGHLKTWEARRQIKFNFHLLTDKGQPLKVDLSKGTKPKVKHKEKKLYSIVESFSDEDERDEVQITVTKASKKSQNVTQFQQDTAISISGLPVNNDLGKIGASTCTSGTKPSEIRSNIYFIKGDKIGCETRSREFKLGGGAYPDRVMKEHVGKYMCGFLNSEEDGELMIGINDDGTVVGIDCNQKQEDDYRLRIDKCIKEVHPSVLPDMYTVQFIPVYLQDGVTLTNKKVIIIAVRSVEIDSLYETRAGVFFRRDGSLQGPLCVADIQQWNKNKHQAEVRQYRNQQGYFMEQLQKQQDTIERLEKEMKTGGKRLQKFVV
ncbi:hypothetical protein ScPMuIL_007895 [Solemya velum]